MKDQEGKFVKPPKPVHNAFSKLYNVKKYFVDNAELTVPLTKEQFLGTYEGRKRGVYERAFESLSTKPFSVRDSYIRWFMKVEKVNFSADKEQIPRGISPRSPRYNALLGPYLKKVEKKIYKMLGSMFGHAVVAKGMNVAQRAKLIKRHWDSFMNPVAIGIDASRFDQHVSREALEWEHSIYTLFYRSKRLPHLLAMQLKNKFFVHEPDGEFTFTTNGVRCSGDMNTSLGNVLLMCAMTYAYLTTKGVKYRFINDGDDGVIFLEKSDLHHLDDLHEYYLQFGFNMKVEPTVDILEQVEFCRSKPVYVGGEHEYIMVRDPRTCLASDCVSIRPLIGEVITRRWMKDVGICGLSLTGGIPVMQEFYNRFVIEGRDLDPFSDPTQLSGRHIYNKDMHRGYGVISDQTRVSFWRAFGWCPTKQIQLEEEIRNLKLYLDGPEPFVLRQLHT